MALLSGLFSDVNMNDAEVSMKVLTDSFIRKMKGPLINFKHIIFNNLHEVDEAIARNEINSLGMFTNNYFNLGQINDFEPFLAGGSNESPFVHYVLLINKQTGINDLKQLKQKTISISKQGYSDWIKIWLDTELYKSEKINSDDFFNKIIMQDTESKAVYELFFKKTDCALISENSFKILKELNPQISNNITVLLRSDELVTKIFAVSKYNNESVMKNVMEAAVRLHEDEEGKQILNLFKIGRMYSVNNESLKASELLYRKYKKFFRKQ
ncbi:MAG: PhnD/SsuA/transferrin family substrate-binding protein [Melioribacteraceae bacterium]|nr:PhnD/SsuA/transferrin family substrate-binding protein [Melioribacteraceae bacterium]